MKLRNLEEKDAPLMLEWMHDEDVCRHMQANFAAKTLDDCKKFIQDSQTDYDNYNFAIADDADEYMGTVSLKHVDRVERHAELGIIVRKAAMGKGFSAYAIRAVMQFAKEAGLNRVVWCVLKENVRANRFYVKCGYSLTDDVPASMLERYRGVTRLNWYSFETV